MKKTDRKAELARYKRALRQAKRVKKQKRYTNLSNSYIAPNPTDKALTPLKQSIMLAIGLSSTLGCQVSKPYMQDPDESGTSSISAGTEINGGNNTSGVMAGSEISGAEVMAGRTVAGQEGGQSNIAGETISGGDMMGGQMTGGLVPTPISTICDEPVIQYNEEGEPNGYTICNQGVVIKTGPANCTFSDRSNACQQDSDCEANEQCLCTSVSISYPICVSATCSLGEDCDVGGCGVSYREGDCSFDLSLSCFTENDECRSSESCDNYGAGCYATPVGWRCDTDFCGEGRPLLTECEVTIAPLVMGEGWVSSIPTSEENDISPKELEQLIEYWTFATQLEHSSVASFARFTMQMLSFGVPADLLLAIQTATADEVKHAQSAAHILSTLTKKQVSFGALPLEGITLKTSRRELIEALIREACMSETLGVAEITEALRLSEQELVSQHLKTLLEDETMHAALAWRSLRWLITSAHNSEQAELIDHAVEIFDLVAIEMGLVQQSYSRPICHHSTLNQWGVLTDSQKYEIRHQAYNEIILPCVRGLEEQLRIA